MILYVRKAIQDIFNNRFLNFVTVITIALSILIVSAFALFFLNANDLMNSWRKGIRVMAYLIDNLTESQIHALERELSALEGVQSATYISKTEGLASLKNQMKRHQSLLQGLKDNPLPDAFEIRVQLSAQTDNAVEVLATHLESLPEIAEVEYGQQWLGRFTTIVNLFRFTGYAMGILFFMASVFITANTIRLVLYSRREEIEIMRLVGAADRFIKAPFYIQGILLGGGGGLIGLFALFITYVIITSKFEQGPFASLIAIRFLSFDLSSAIFLASMLVGWLGCYLSLRQFLKI
jgi:cell division transport system permease protein